MRKPGLRLDETLQQARSRPGQSCVRGGGRRDVPRSAGAGFGRRGETSACRCPGPERGFGGRENPRPSSSQGRFPAQTVGAGGKPQQPRAAPRAWMGEGPAGDAEARRALGWIGEAVAAAGEPHRLPQSSPGRQLLPLGGQNRIQGTPPFPVSVCVKKDTDRKHILF